MADDKFCPHCKKIKSIKEFYPDRNRKDGLNAYCKLCNKGYGQKYYWQNKEKINKRQKKHYHKVRRGKELETRYGLTVEQRKLILENQDGVCIICKKPETVKKYGHVQHLCVDHDHKTGEIRGLLCYSCNALLGYAKDDIVLLQQAIKYLREHSNGRVNFSPINV